MKILVLSDVQEFEYDGERGKADILLSCGDNCDHYILSAAKAFGCRQVFAVKGNHDSPMPFSAGIGDLHLKTAEFEGLALGGFNGCWKYKPKGHFLHTQDEATELLRDFPRVDIFLAHNSPAGIHDRQDDVHNGFDAFTEYIRRRSPSLFIHGHQHADNKSTVGQTEIIGVYGHKVIEIQGGL